MGDWEMNRIATIACAGAAAFAVAACSSWSEPPEDNFLRAHATEPTGSEFDRNLHANYLLVAGQERTAFNWPASRHFSDKALQAASGQRVEPDTLEGRDLSAEEEAELVQARQDLIANLEAGADSRDPAGAAWAQVAFDCWVQETAAPGRRGNIAACRNDFFAAVDTLSPQSNTYAVFFPFDSTDAGAEGSAVAEQAAAALTAKPDQKIQVIGHADQTGSSDYNLALSKRRAEEVKRLLITAGVPEDKIEVIAQGDTQPKVVSGSDRREAGNRRVDIRFSP